MPEKPMFPIPQYVIDNYTVLNNSPQYIGFKFTFTFNPRKWSLAEAWKRGLEEIDNQVNCLYTDLNAKYYLTTTEAHKNLYPHVHGVLFVSKTYFTGYTVLDKYIKRFQRVFGRNEFVRLDNDRDYEYVKAIVGSDNDKVSLNCWLSYILKDTNKFATYIKYCPRLPVKI